MSLIRKPIQIACLPMSLGPNGLHHNGALYALCDDGSIWFREFTSAKSSKNTNVWDRVESIPGSEEPYNQESK